MKTPSTLIKPKAGTTLSNGKLTPVMQQYMQIKDKHPDDIVFFRLGDFYEMFFDDAIKASPIMEVALTKRQTTPMCGVPHHAATGYIAKLLKAGVSVALAEQLEDPKKTKGMVKRGVVRVVTPGTIVEDELLPSKANNFLVALSIRRSNRLGSGHWALSAADVSTGRQWVGEVKDDLNWNQLKAQLAALNPSEILLVGDDTREASKDFSFNGVLRLEPTPTEFKDFPDQTLQAIKNYLERDHSAPGQILGEPEPLPVESAGILLLDESAIRHLELVESADPFGRNAPSLLSILDQTVTALGSRLMRWWVLHPSTRKEEIQERLNQVEAYIDESGKREGMRTQLKDVADLERILVRAQAGTASPRDLSALRHSFLTLPSLLQMLPESDMFAEEFRSLKERLCVPEDLIRLLQTQLSDEPPYKVVMGGVIRAGFHSDLDELRDFRRSGKKWIAEMEASEREKTGITNLKVGYNDVFGYYLEVSKSHLSKVPDAWNRKQTLANAERFITPELKDQEGKILGAQEKILALETRLYADLVKHVATFGSVIAKAAAALAHLDGVASLSQVSVENNYVRPKISDSDLLDIKGGRHPVIEAQLGRDRFIPNDVTLGGDGKRISIITGPNMAGKSTYLRQSALIVIMAQMGSFIPAESAEIGLVDRIFTRIGATDRLAQGQSTFMVEMVEVATLLLNSTKRSLLVLDEVGRGTSTYDGVSIAWAVIDYLNDSTRGSRTLFATHYFELTQLADSLPSVMNAHATAKEWPGADGRRQVVFLYQIQPGPADRSYGIHVAEMAGIPDECVDRAREILKQLESGTHQLSKVEKHGVPQAQLDLFSTHPIVEELKKLPVEQMTPLEALNKLHELRNKC